MLPFLIASHQHMQPYYILATVVTTSVFAGCEAQNCMKVSGACILDAFAAAVGREQIRQWMSWVWVQHPMHTALVGSGQDWSVVADDQLSWFGVWHTVGHTAVCCPLKHVCGTDTVGRLSTGLQLAQCRSSC